MKRSRILIAVLCAAFLLLATLRTFSANSSLFRPVISFLMSQQPAPFVANYDEAKVGTFTLPDPLVMKDGRKVTTAKQWRARRAEILADFATQVYGRTPSVKTKLHFEEKLRDPKSLDGLATRREIAIRLTDKADGPRLNLLLYTPNKSSGSVPAFLGMNFDGNQAVHADPTITLPTAWMDKGKGVVNNRATEESRGVEASRWQVEMILSRGYALATFYYGDLFPDHKNGLSDSIIPHFSDASRNSLRPDDWNAIGAWAWGMSRAMDYLEHDKAIDAKRIAVIGHSRLGKAALWAAAQDERFALVVANESGEGGAALARRNFGETVARINTSFPHWFCANFKQYNERVNDLPVDQHQLLALIAPRPLYVASAAEDLWADPRGEFLSAVEASSVYRLLGREALAATQSMPAIHQPLMTTVGYHIRAGKHDVTKYDWEQFLNFADKHLSNR